jgi:hypothetical protein
MLWRLNSANWPHSQKNKLRKPSCSRAVRRKECGQYCQTSFSSRFTFRYGVVCRFHGWTPKLSTVLPATQCSIVHGGKQRCIGHNLLSSHIALPSHAAGRDDNCVLGWSPDRHLPACRKLGLNFALDPSARSALERRTPAVAFKPDYQSARQPLDRRGLSSDNLLL